VLGDHGPAKRPEPTGRAVQRPYQKPASERRVLVVVKARSSCRWGGWRQYAGYLERQLAAADAKRRYASLSQGWAIGSEAFQAATIAQHAPVGSTRAWTLPGADQMRQAHWNKYLLRALASLGHSTEQARLAPQGEIWKLAVATWMRDAARARSNWLGEQLRLGAPSVISRNLARYRSHHQHSDPNWIILISSFSA